MNNTLNIRVTVDDGIHDPFEALLLQFITLGSEICGVYQEPNGALDYIEIAKLTIINPIKP